MSSPAAGFGPSDHFARAFADDARHWADGRTRHECELGLAEAQAALRPAFAKARQALADALAPVFRLPFGADPSDHAGPVAAALEPVGEVVRRHDAIPIIRAAAGSGLALWPLCSEGRHVPLDSLPPDRATPAALADRLGRVESPAVESAFTADRGRYGPSGRPARLAVLLVLQFVGPAGSPAGRVGAVRAVMADPGARAALGWLLLVASLLDPDEYRPDAAPVYVPHPPNWDGTGAPVWRLLDGSDDRERDGRPRVKHAHTPDRDRVAWLCGKVPADPALTDALFPDLIPVAPPAAVNPDPAPPGGPSTPSAAFAVEPLAGSEPVAAAPRTAPAGHRPEPARLTNTHPAVDPPALALAYMAAELAAGRRPTMDAIAEAAGVARQRLHDAPKFAYFRKQALGLGVMRRASDRRRPRGHRDADGRVEAYAGADD